MFRPFLIFIYIILLQSLISPVHAFPLPINGDPITPPTTQQHAEPHPNQHVLDNDHSNNNGGLCETMFGIPRLRSVPLEERSLNTLIAPVEESRGGAYSGGTAACRLNKTAAAIRPPVSKPWKSSSLQSPARLRGNSTKAYYREQVFNVKEYPWNTIGRLFFSRFEGDRGGWCTATLVGSNLIITASHCYPWGYGRDNWMRFVPGFGNGTEPFGSSYVSRCRGIRNAVNVTGTDYIVCELCQPLGQKTGWMGTHWWSRDSVYKQRRWKSSGYPVDSYKGNSLMLLSDLWVDEVHTDGRYGKEIETRVFASPGWSGGPLWEYIDGEPRIVGICSGGERACSQRTEGCAGLDAIDDYHDVSAGGRLMTELVRQAGSSNERLKQDQKQGTAVVADY